MFERPSDDLENGEYAGIFDHRVVDAALRSEQDVDVTWEKDSWHRIWYSESLGCVVAKATRNRARFEPGGDGRPANVFTWVEDRVFVGLNRQFGKEHEAPCPPDPAHPDKESVYRWQRFQEMRTNVPQRLERAAAVVAKEITDWGWEVEVTEEFRAAYDAWRTFREQNQGT